MTLDEAIQHLEDTLSDNNHEWSCAECKAEHEQLAVWLKELKEIRKVVKEFTSTHDMKEDCRMDMIIPFCEIVKIVKEAEND